MTIRDSAQARILAGKRRAGEIPCVVCATPITGTTRRRYCSHRCQMISWRGQQAEDRATLSSLILGVQWDDPQFRRELVALGVTPMLSDRGGPGTPLIPSEAWAQRVASVLVRDWPDVARRVIRKEMIGVRSSLRPDPPRPCIHCGNDIAAPHPRQRYCGERCKRQAEQCRKQLRRIGSTLPPRR